MPSPPRSTPRKPAVPWRRWAMVAPAGWLVLVAAVALPQMLVASDTSVILAASLGVLLLAGWVGLVFVVARQWTSFGVGAGAGVAVVVLMHVISSDDYQEALLLRAGRALDGVTLAEAIAGRDEDVWIRITDARVRSEASEEVSFVTGGGRDSNGGIRPTTTTTIALAPVTLATEVSDETPVLRRRPAGEIVLWACAGSTHELRGWDHERQAVRGRLEPIERDVAAQLERKVRPQDASVIPGAGAIPAAPGAASGPTMPVAKPVLLVAREPWCVHLDRTLDAATARDQAWDNVLALVLSTTFFTALMGLGFVAMMDSSSTPARR